MLLFPGILIAALTGVNARKLRDATEVRMRQVSDNGRLAQWVGDPRRRKD